MCLKDYIPDADQYISYPIAEEAEEHPIFWVDSLSDDHIEIHNVGTDDKQFRHAIRDFINERFDELSFKVQKERLFIDNKYHNLSYVILDMNGCVRRVKQESPIPLPPAING